VHVYVFSGSGHCRARGTATAPAHDQAWSTGDLLLLPSGPVPTSKRSRKAFSLTGCMTPLASLSLASGPERPRCRGHPLPGPLDAPETGSLGRRSQQVPASNRAASLADGQRRCCPQSHGDPTLWAMLAVTARAIQPAPSAHQSVPSICSDSTCQPRLASRLRPSSINCRWARSVNRAEAWPGAVVRPFVTPRALGIPHVNQSATAMLATDSRCPAAQPICSSLDIRFTAAGLQWLSQTRQAASATRSLRLAGGFKALHKWRNGSPSRVSCSSTPPPTGRAASRRQLASVNHRLTIGRACWPTLTHLRNAICRRSRLAHSWRVMDLQVAPETWRRGHRPPGPRPKERGMPLQPKEPKEVHRRAYT